MASNRANKSGFAKDIQQKMQAKYDPELASQCLNWMKTLLRSKGEAADFSTDGSGSNLHAALEDGYCLCKLMNILKPGSIPDKKLAKKETMAFKKMELIGLFCDKAKEYGVPQEEVFQTVDLYEQQNLYQVVVCLSSLARKAQKNGHIGFGPKESEENRREFTEEQLKAGQGVIGLQMGTNKGASQAGMNIGKTRHIVD
ncbi:hypothetical protein CHS0354_010972 [Potamilus streckersoni]|uniref:Transgelin n=1 Tax=Potamilus streckersoni TaxID=2493646 RepID=A0AAE0VH63_9BIVA|nr:hypothetical protein CHS0354_010972 [Potamilus streckersoni]